MNMSIRSVLMGMLIVGTAYSADPDNTRVKKLFESKNYTVTWGETPPFAEDAELEIGDGGGHGFTLGWVRLRPSKDGVDVLSIRLKEERKPYNSTWPLDTAPVVVQSARMKTEAYKALLQDLAVVNAATVKETEKRESVSSSLDFWVHTRLTADKKTLLDLNWAGYWGSANECKFAKPQAAMTLAREAVESLDFKDHKLTDNDRAWASDKFTRDWKVMQDDDFAWWVRERYLIMIGVIGDAAALPTLRDLLSSQSKDSHDRKPYYAINAVTRLTKKDVRDKPVEEMDVEKTRKKVHELLKDAK